MTPAITFALPAYSRPTLLAQAVASIDAQTDDAPAEIVICDDAPGRTEAGSSLTAAAVAATPGRHPRRYLANAPALGPVENWNRCLAEARGEWVSVLHEDDLVYPNYLSLIQARIRQSPAPVAVAVRVDQGAQPEGAGGNGAASPEVWTYPPRWFLKSSMTPFPGVMIRTDVARRLGGFDLAWGPLADYEFWYRLACAGPVEIVREIGAFYRIAPGQWTERAWPRMIRLTHLLRLRIAREQFAASPRAGLWYARYFTYRNALSYARRFPERPAELRRALRLGRIPGAFLPSGWVWRALRSSPPAGARA